MHAGSHLYGTEKVIWAGFGPVGKTEKKMADYEQLLRAFFSCFQGNFFKRCRICTEKLRNISFIFFFTFFLAQNWRNINN